MTIYIVFVWMRTYKLKDIPNGALFSFFTFMFVLSCGLPFFFLSKINYAPLYSNALLLKKSSQQIAECICLRFERLLLLFHCISVHFYAFGISMVRCGLTGMLLIMSHYVNLEFSTHSRCKCNKLNCFISRLLTRPSTFECLRTFELFDRIICNPIEMEFHSIAMNRNETKRNKNRSNLIDFCSLQKFNQITRIF